MILASLTDIKKTFKIPEREKGLRGAVRSLGKRKFREIHAVDGLSMEIQSGEILGFIGPNGAGKSTTVKILTGILTPDSGEVQVDGLVPHRKRQELAGKIGVVFGQRTRLWWPLPAEESLRYMKALYSIPDKTYRENVEYLTEVLGIGELLSLPVRSLSLGQRMRMELSAAMLHNPKLLYLDEPTVGLDVAGKHELRELIRRLNRDREITVLLITHDVIDLEKLCSRLMVIDRGRLIWEGSVQGLHEFHGKRREVRVEFIGEGEPLKTDGVTVVSADGSKYHYQVDTDVLPMDEFLKLIAGRGGLLDIRVEEPAIEDIIRKIYKG